MWKGTGRGTDKKIFVKKNNVGGIALPYNKAYHIATVIKIV